MSAGVGGVIPLGAGSPEGAGRSDGAAGEDWTLAGMLNFVLQPGQRTILPAISGSAFNCMSHLGHLNFTGGFLQGDD